MFTATQLAIPLLFLVFKLLSTVAFTLTSYVPKCNLFYVLSKLPKSILQFHFQTAV